MTRLNLLSSGFALQALLRSVGLAESRLSGSSNASPDPEGWPNPVGPLG